MVGWVAGRGLVGVRIMLVMFEGKYVAGMVFCRSVGRLIFFFLGGMDEEKGIRKEFAR